MIANILNILVVYTSPLVVLLIGMMLFAFIAYVNWFGNIKECTIRWIAQKIFRNEAGSTVSAEQLFMHITMLLLVVCVLWILVAVGYLTT